MTKQLKLTGERVIEDAYHNSLASFVIYVTHAASYAFAERFCTDLRVIDLGCGSGYGAARIAKVAQEVVGVDISEDAVAFAGARYVSPNLKFFRINPNAPLPFADATFDVALSFQVIEHIQADEAYLSEAYRLLRPGGKLLVITPDRQHRLLPWQRPWNRWHVREYSMPMLTRVVSRVFCIEESLRMGAPWSIAGIEFRRYYVLKWLTLPVTLPIIPDWLRRWGLNLIHSLRRKPPLVSSESSKVAPDYGFNEADILIGEDVPNSMNLIVVASKPVAGEV